MTVLVGIRGQGSLFLKPCFEGEPGPIESVAQVLGGQRGEIPFSSQDLLVDFPGLRIRGDWTWGISPIHT